MFSMFISLDDINFRYFTVTQSFFSMLTDDAKNLFSIVTASGNIRQLYYLQGD